MKIDTLVIHAGEDHGSKGGAVIPPLHLSTTFERDSEGNYPDGYMYTRHGNPNRTALESCIAALEGGAEAACFSSGSAAAMGIFQALQPGDHVIVPQDMYRGIQQLIGAVMKRWQLQFSFIDMHELEPALQANTRLIWIESPSNPLMNVYDIRKITALAREKNIITVCDNTFATPVFQQPLELGVDLVMHSTTKYMGGHSDVLGGAVICREKNDFWEKIKGVQTLGGGVLAPFECYLTLRGIKTLACRMRVHNSNALALATWLEKQPGVEKVFHPGLPSHPGHEVARGQMSGYGGMFSFLINGGAEEGLAFVAACKLFKRATSLGGVESLIEHRASQEGSGSLAPDNLIRVSTGIEDIDDIIKDLEQAFQQ